MRILLIEDNPDHVELIQSSLTNAFESDLLIECDDLLYSGLDKLQANPFDICLCDLQLKDSSREQTIGQLRSLDSGTPIIVLTSQADEATAESLISDGVQDYLYKGNLSANNLRNSIKYAIDRKAYTHYIETNRKEQLSLCLSLSSNLKSPLRRINFQLASIQEQIAKSDVNLENSLQPLFNGADSEIAVMRHTVDDIYTLFSSEITADRVEDCDPGELFMQAYNSLAEKRVTLGELRIESGKVIPANKSLLLILFEKILIYIHTIASSKPVITFSHVQSSDQSHQEFSLTDTAEPITLDYLPHIFEPFQSAGQSDDGFRTGLEMSIVKKMVDLHCGTVSVHPEKNGNTYRLRFPVGGNAKLN